MTDTKFTPGPWHWWSADGSFRGLSGPDELEDHVLWSGICPACQKSGGRCTAANDADEALIASAPDLYAACVDALHMLGQLNHDAMCNGVHSPDDLCQGEHYFGVVADKLQAALMKARGEQQ